MFRNKADEKQEKSPAGTPLDGAVVTIAPMTNF